MEVASRWGHVKMVEYFLAKVDFNPNALKKAKAKSLNNEIKSLFSMKLKGNHRGAEEHGSVWFWGCRLFC